MNKEEIKKVVDFLNSLESGKKYLYTCNVTNKFVVVNFEPSEHFEKEIWRGVVINE